MLNDTLSTERCSWKTEMDELQKKDKIISIDLDECTKLIEQGKQEQRNESESLICKLQTKVNIQIKYIFQIP